MLTGIYQPGRLVSCRSDVVDRPSATSGRSDWGLVMSRLRAVPVVAAAVLAMLTVTALASPADAKGHPAKRQAVTMLHKQLGVPQRAAALGVRVAHEGENGEAETLRARTEYQQSIIAAPAEVAPAGGLLAAALARAAALPVRGRGWNEATDKPFLNDPVGPRPELRRGSWPGHGPDDRIHRPRPHRLGRLGQRRSVAHPRSGPYLAYGQLRPAATGHRRARHLPGQRLGLGRHRGREQLVGWPVRRRDLPAASRFPHLAPGRARSPTGASVHRIVWIRKYVYAATSHGLYRRAGTPRPARTGKPFCNQPDQPSTRRPPM